MIKALKFLTTDQLKKLGITDDILKLLDTRKGMNLLMLFADGSDFSYMGGTVTPDFNKEKREQILNEIFGEEKNESISQ